jgi:hypothetical protein
MKETLKATQANGFRYAYTDKSLHAFTKQNEAGQWELILCNTQDITNGNFQFMAQHGLSRKANQ